MTYTANPHHRPEAVPPPAGAEVQAFHRNMPGYRPSPVRSVDGLLVKDESNRFGLPAFKILGASWAIERTVRARPRTRVLVAASAGNHGRAVARVAAQRGLGCRIYLPAVTSAGRADLIAGEGADVVRVDGDYNAAVALAEQDAARPGSALVADTALTPTEGPPEWVIDGYSTLFREIDVPTDVVLVPTGVGSLAAAAVRWAVHERPGTAVIAVEPATAACVTASIVVGRMAAVDTPGTSMAGMDCASPSAVAWPTLLHGLSGTITVTDVQAAQAMRDLARGGLTIGDCGAATVAAWRAHGEPGRSVLCVATEGASDPDAYAEALSA
ncbi:pyridoxal-phosphate dependent enzyme [Umezawaea sp. Da 62-37]|uniref:pyridoxal-phosphate dependent enzyme n=1 Tax=Umezawaea sp. Da 62-37 TaxID=3075927 RepID=UPI0028F6E229|nr:pyridoxal-phosphate dependent enzyme [Umezawaea sp. Da 62-37]WNV90056.1 pyridoxal-phosphate dependent enzyme [Umezawaea sp. Da 62-37]